MHALHGNGPPSGWRGGQPPKQQGSLAPRELQDLQPVGRLRAAGWDLPATLPDSHLLRVYDTRMEPGYLEQLHGDLGLPGVQDEKLFVIGGDFWTRPFREDGDALCPTALRRWGPEVDNLYSIMVPPRPHLAEWFGRAKHQVALERAGTWISICCVVPRERCFIGSDATALKLLVPQAKVILEDQSLEVRVALVGERAPVMRVPAGTRQLPLHPRNVPYFLSAGCWWWCPSVIGMDHLSFHMLSGCGANHRHRPGRTWSCFGWSSCCRPPLASRLLSELFGLASASWRRPWA